MEFNKFQELVIENIRTIMVKKKVKSMAQLARMTDEIKYQRLKMVFSGAQDFRLEELHKIALCLDTTVSKLTSGGNNNDSI